jgi:prohibitin 2
MTSMKSIIFKFKLGSFLGIILFLAFIFLSLSVRIVDEGERTVVTRFGQYDRSLDPGVHFTLPFIEKTTVYEVRTQKIEVNASGASKDLQTVNTRVAVNFNIRADRVKEVYRDVQNDYMVRIVEPSIQESIKASTAQFNAEALITRRSEVRESIINLLEERLSRRGIEVTDVSIVDFQFSDEFNKAIEAKVTAEQRALEAENKLRQVEFESQQRIEQARGEAEAIRIQSQAITQQGGKEYVQLQWIEAWRAGGAQVPKTILGNDANFLFKLDID